jgi:hypothetical protein
MERGCRRAGAIAIVWLRCAGAWLAGGLAAAGCGLLGDRDPAPAEMEASAQELRDAVERSIASEVVAAGATSAAATGAAASGAVLGAAEAGRAGLRDPKVLMVLAERAEERIAAGDREEGIVLLNTLVHASLNASVALLGEVVARVRAKDLEGAEALTAAANALASASDVLRERRNVAYVALKASYPDVGEGGRRAIVLALWRVGVACEMETAAAKFVMGLPAVGDTERVMRLRNVAVDHLLARGARAEAVDRASASAARLRAAADALSAAAAAASAEPASGAPATAAAASAGPASGALATAAAASAEPASGAPATVPSTAGMR